MTVKAVMFSAPVLAMVSVYVISAPMAARAGEADLVRRMPGDTMSTVAVAVSVRVSGPGAMAVTVTVLEKGSLSRPVMVCVYAPVVVWPGLSVVVPRAIAPPASGLVAWTLLSVRRPVLRTVTV